MDSKQIKVLLDRYYNGETTREEEKMLFQWFQRKDIPPEFTTERELFAYFKTAAQEEVSGNSFEEDLARQISFTEKREKVKKRQISYYFIGIAASIAVILSLWIVFTPGSIKPNKTLAKDTYTDPELAMQKVKETLYFVSGTLASGTEKLQNLETLEKSSKPLENIATFHKGYDNLYELSKFNEARLTITKK